MQGSSSGELEDIYPPRATGEPLIPFLSVDGQVQDVDSGVSAAEIRAEAGYGPFGFEYRTTDYHERRPADTLTITRAHFLCRMLFSNHVEIDVGPGYATHSGDRSTTGFSLTIPLRVYPCSALGAELRPSWAQMPGGTISDCSLLAVVRRLTSERPPSLSLDRSGGRNSVAPTGNVCAHSRRPPPSDKGLLDHRVPSPECAPTGELL